MHGSKSICFGLKVGMAHEHRSHKMYERSVGCHNKENNIHSYIIAKCVMSALGTYEASVDSYVVLLFKVCLTFEPL